jgi:pyruvate/2-oxoglutarate dehydrogenase complex dihydrolipoamide acyltransferase (E2) component
MWLSITSDHAIVDGVPHGRFMTLLAERVRDPEKYIEI